MLSTGLFAESSQQMLRVDDHDGSITAKTFKEMLHYIYSDRVDIEGENVMELW